MLTEAQINKCINFIIIAESIIPDFALRGYDGETILNHDGNCPICTKKLNEYSYRGPIHELHFDFFSGTYWCQNQCENESEGNIIDFVVISKKITRDEAVAWVNDLIK